MSGLKLVNLGLPKTGTTTLAKALRRGGLRVADHRIRRHQTEDTARHGSFVADLLYQGLYTTGDPAAPLDSFGALSEISLLREDRSLWPQMDFTVIDALRRHHPTLRFVATRRDTWEISQSMLAWRNLGTVRLPKAQIPGLPTGYGTTSKERMQWIDGHYAHLAAIFAGDPCYLELDVAATDARATLAAHLDIELPWWGRANRNPIREAL